MSEYTILLAEDDSAQRELLELSLMISEPGIRIVNAKSREEILEAARNTPLDCAVIDFNLPPYQAPEIIEDLQEMHAEMPIIVISASEHQSVVIESLRTGVSDFVPKIKAVSGGYLWERVLDAIRDAEQTRRERRRINRRLKDLRDLAETDPLTGLANRRACDRVIRQMASRPDRRGAVSITMIDLDRFKSINDTQGHAAGDEALKQVAEIVRDELRANDIAARWGGEEMVVLRQSETIVDAWIWADNLRRRIGAEVRVGADKLRVTASMGVETVPVEDLSDGAITRADNAMYLAKESGRNRVCTWPMAHAVSMAHDLGCDPALSVRERLERLISLLSRDLGAIQREHTGAHGRDVRRLCVDVAERFGLGDRSLEALALAAEFHDIGKLGIPEELLAAPRILTLDERRFVNVHASLGAAIFRACRAQELVAKVVELHHQRFDNGTGSPDAVRLASVVCACDAYSAMTNSRPYCETLDRDQAIRELEFCCGSQFSPEVVAALKPSARIWKNAA